MKKLSTASFFFISLILLILNGCATVRPVQPRTTKITHVYTKNYVLNQELKAYVGMEIVKVKDYYVKNSETNRLKASNDFSVKLFGAGSYNGKKDEEYSLVGQTEQNEGTEYLINLPGMNYIRFCINQDGTMSERIIGEMNQKMAFSPEITPSSTRFVFVSSEEVVQDKGFTNYELIYTGISESNINLLYREYTPQDMARQPYYQNLTYPIGSKTIRFKGTLIDISKINQEEIVYKVISDGIVN